MGETRWFQPGEDLQRILDDARPGDVIGLEAGQWRQKVCLRTPHVTLRGRGADKTLILWDDYALKKDGEGRELNTFRTFTMAVCAPGVTLEDLTVMNDAGQPETKGQEVALSVVADGFTLRRCHLISTQDTLFAGPLPPDLIQRYEGFLADELRREGPMTQRYENSLIAGSVDFIFGCAEAVFENCEIQSVYDVRQCGYAAAPAHGLQQQAGFLFRRCRFTCREGVRPQSIYLARPWRDHGLAVFEDCHYGPHIAPAGFDKWNDTHRDETARFRESPPQPGRVPWVNRR